MSKYRPLSDHLASLIGDEWRPSFGEIETVLGAPLPKAAKQPAWWTGADKSHHRAWLDHDWRISAVGDGRVLFKRTVAHEVQPPALKAAAEIASTRAHVRQNISVAAVVGGALALAAGLGVVVVKALKGRKA